MSCKCAGSHWNTTKPTPDNHTTTFSCWNADGMTVECIVRSRFISINKFIKGKIFHNSRCAQNIIYCCKGVTSGKYRRLREQQTAYRSEALWRLSNPDGNFFMQAKVEPAAFLSTLACKITSTSRQRKLPDTAKWKSVPWRKKPI